MKTKILSLILALSLLFCTAALAGCSKDEPTGETTTAEATTAAQTTAEAATEATTAAEAEQIGTGSVSFMFNVTFADGSTKSYKVSTDKKTVGEALSELKLIDGEVGEYGLYIKTVDGVTVDYDTDKSYWAFYIDGEYAQTSVDKTDIAEGSVYELKVQK